MSTIIQQTNNAGRSVAPGLSCEVDTNIEDNDLDCYCCNKLTKLPRTAFQMKNPALCNFLESKIKRTYERPYNWYYIVFTPMNKPYSRDENYFRNKGLIDCSKKLKSMKCTQVRILTREIEATKVHINALTVCKDDLVAKYHNKMYKNKYFMHIQHVNYTERYRVLQYITKEADNRPFNNGEDYIQYLHVPAESSNNRRAVNCDEAHILIL